MVTTYSSSDVKIGPEVFINFRGDELRNNFISHLHKRLKRNGINAFIDSDESAGQELKNLFKRIENSKIALAVLSSRYTESHWCLQELVKMMECCMKGEGCNNNLLVIPIFYKLEISEVAELEGDFGRNLWNLWRLPGRGRGRDNRIVKWNEALEGVLSRKALILAETGKENEFLSTIVTHVKNVLSQIPPQREQNPKPHLGGSEGNPKPQHCLIKTSNNVETHDQRLKQLEAKLEVECNDDKARIVGVVGMHGIGKTYLVEKLFVKLQGMFNHCVFIKFEHEKLNEQGPEWLQKRLLEGLLDQDQDQDSRFEDKDAYEFLKNRLDQDKIVVVLDNVIDRKQIDEFFRNCDWITKGSKIIITTRDKSLTKGLVSDLYEVPGLNERDGLELFRTQISDNLEGHFMEMSKKFVKLSGGNPLALKEFGEELKEKEEHQWEAKLGTLTQSFKKELRICYNELNDHQKDAFLDIAYFFRSQDENYVTSLLDHESSESSHEFRDLADKFLISLNDGRVEMHDLWFAMAKELVEANEEKSRLFSSNSAEFTSFLRQIEGRDKVRGIVLDMSKMEQIPLKKQAFVGMTNLRYLKVYNSMFLNNSEVECKLNLTDGLEFPKDNLVRCFHWFKFPINQLPSNLEPKYLIDLRLPYSKITTLWDSAKVTPNLKWVDLSYSSELTSLSSLSDSPNLLKLNLEGCMSLKELHEEMRNMKNLMFLNLRGCISLLSLPPITINSLTTLILSGCSKLQTFKVVSENLEFLYLNGTAIVELPLEIGNLQRLILLNLKDCKNLVTLPDCLGKIKSLQELKLSRCFELKSFLNVEESLRNLQVLLLDGTSISKIPVNSFDLCMLRRLCLSRNDKICSIEFDMSQMLHLKWLELKHCSNLKSLSRLPYNLQCLNAHNCTSLRTVSSPLAVLKQTEQIHFSFSFTNCHELEQVSKDSILSYIRSKSELMSHDQYNQAFVFKSLISTCFPGFEIPAWFNHQELGSALKIELPRNWNEGRLALCVVVSFKDYKDQNNSLQVKCTCEFTNVSLSSKSFIIGGWSESDDELHMVNGDHIFIGFTDLLNMKKHQHLSSDIEAFLKFEVRNDTSEVEECKVIKCGFTLVYESDEAENTTWETNLTTENIRYDQRSSFKTADDDCPNASPTTADHKREKRSWFLW